MWESLVSFANTETGSINGTQGDYTRRNRTVRIESPLDTLLRRWGEGSVSVNGRRGTTDT